MMFAKKGIILSSIGLAYLLLMFLSEHFAPKCITNFATMFF